MDEAPSMDCGHSSNIQAPNNPPDALDPSTSIAAVQIDNPLPAILQQTTGVDSPSTSSMQMSDNLADVTDGSSDSGSPLPSTPEYAASAMVDCDGAPHPQVLNQTTDMDVEPAAPSNQGTDTHADTIEKSKCIGPYTSAVGLTKDHFAVPISDGVYPNVAIIKNGLVLELLTYLTKVLKYPDCSVVNVLCKLSVEEDFLGTKYLTHTVKRLWTKRVKLKRNTKGEALKELLDGEFKLVRTPRVCKSPETPREKRSRMELKLEKAEHRVTKRKLAAAERSMVTLNQKIMENEGLLEALQKERHAKEAVFKDLAHLQVESEAVKTRLSNTLVDYEHAVSQLNELKNNYNLMKDEFDIGEQRFKEVAEKNESLERKYCNARAKLSQLSTRNVNKRIRRRDKAIAAEKEKNAELVKDKDGLNHVVKDLTDELRDNQAKLEQSEREQRRLKDQLAAMVPVEMQFPVIKQEISE